MLRGGMGVRMQHVRGPNSGRPGLPVFHSFPFLLLSGCLHVQRALVIVSHSVFCILYVHHVARV